MRTTTLSLRPHGFARRDAARTGRRGCYCLFLRYLKPESDTESGNVTRSS
jgi:hypothetical protein